MSEFWYEGLAYSTECYLPALGQKDSPIRVNITHSQSPASFCFWPQTDLNQAFTSLNLKRLLVLLRGTESDDGFEQRLAALKKAKGQTPYGESRAAEIPKQKSAGTEPECFPATLSPQRVRHLLAHGCFTALFDVMGVGPFGGHLHRQYLLA
jgi:hypothetical protein